MVVAREALRSAVLIGKENVGKTQLASSLAGRGASASNFRGATVACQAYRLGDWDLIDTPGLLLQSDAETTRIVLDRLEGDDVLVLVVQATHLESDLRDLLELTAGRRGFIVATFLDRADRIVSEARLRELERLTGTPVAAVDARRISDDERARVLQALEKPGVLPDRSPELVGGAPILPARTLLERPAAGPLTAAALLLAPAWASVEIANRAAGWIDPFVSEWLAPVAQALAFWPQPAGEILAGDYGLLTMGPLLLVWAFPVVVLHALFLGAYKASGLLDRLTVSLTSLLRPFGLTGREAARIVMGFGCNVPAVISTRASSACSRGVCVSAIAYGSACSYQMGATLAVFAAAGRSDLVFPFLLYLAGSTLLYTRLISPARARSPLNVLLTEGRVFLTLPSLPAIWREARGVVREFLQRALPVFVVITGIASLVNWFGGLELLARLIQPVMAAFRLPADAALAVVLASVRKDGIVLLAEPALATSLSGSQLLTAVYLAGVLLPCLVTLLTVAREQGARFALRLAGRQAAAAAAFSLVLAWGARWLA